MNTITLPQKAFKAVELAMAVKDIRYYLCGVCIEHNGEETRLAATDGHRLNLVRIEHPEGVLCAPIQAIIPAAMVKTICKAKVLKGDNSDIVITINGTKASALLPDGTETVATLIDGKFPDYARVIPDSFDGVASNYNPEYITDAMKSAGYWMDYKNWQFGFSFVQNGLSVGGIALPNFAAVVMPCRGHYEPKGIDAALKQPLRAPEQAKEVTA